MSPQDPKKPAPRPAPPASPKDAARPASRSRRVAEARKARREAPDAANEKPGARVRRELEDDARFAVLGLYDANATLEISPDDARRLARFGLGLAEKGDTEGALDAARVALAADDDCALAHALMGSLLARGKQLREALAHYQRAQTLAPERVRSWVDAGEIRLLLGEFKEAAADFRQALALDPKGETPAGQRAMALIVKTLMTVAK